MSPPEEQQALDMQGRAEIPDEGSPTDFPTNDTGYRVGDSDSGFAVESRTEEESWAVESASPAVDTEVGSEAGAEAPATEPSPVESVLPMTAAAATVSAAPAGQFFERRRAYGRRWTDNVRRLAVICLTVAGILLSIAILRYLSLVLLPFALAFVLAYLLNPVAVALSSMLKSRGAAVGLTVAGFGVALVLGTMQLAPLIGGQVKDFSDGISTMWLNVQRSIAVQRYSRAYMPDELSEIPEPRGAYASRIRSQVGLREFLSAWAQYLKSTEQERAVAIAEARKSMAGTYIGALIDNTIMYIQNRPLEAMINHAVQNILLSGGQALWTVIMFLALVGVFIVALVYLVLLLIGFPEYTQVWRAFLPVALQGYLGAVGQEYHRAMNMYFCRQFVAAVITAAAFCIGFSAVKLPLAIPFGIFCGMLSMIPYLQLVGIAPAIVLAGFHAIEAREPFTPLVLGVLLTFVFIQLLQELILRPFLVGRGHGFERLCILLGAFVWPLLLKPALGIVVAIPLTCVFIALYRVKARQLEAAAEQETAASSLPVGAPGLLPASA